jgi:hypothetical protein
VATSEELLQLYLEADAHHREEWERYYAIWSPPHPKPSTETLTPERLAYLRDLGDKAEAARIKWLDSY